MITAIEPQVALNGRYSIGQAAALLGIHRNTLRRYNDNGYIKNGVRKAGGNRRFFLGSEILRFWRAQL